MLNVEWPRGRRPARLPAPGPFNRYHPRRGIGTRAQLGTGMPSTRAGSKERTRRRARIVPSPRIPTGFCSIRASTISPCSPTRTRIQATLRRGSRRPAGRGRPCRRGPRHGTGPQPRRADLLAPHLEPRVVPEADPQARAPGIARRHLAPVREDQPLERVGDRGGEVVLDEGAARVPAVPVEGEGEERVPRADLARPAQLLDVAGQPRGVHHQVGRAAGFPATSATEHSRPAGAAGRRAGSRRAGRPGPRGGARRGQRPGAPGGEPAEGGEADAHGWTIGDAGHADDTPWRTARVGQRARRADRPKPGAAAAP
jgi:hypothetical protein